MSVDREGLNVKLCILGAAVVVGLLSMPVFQNNSLQEKYEEQQEKYDDLQIKYEDLQEKYDDLQIKYEELASSSESYRDELYAVISSTEDPLNILYDYFDDESISFDKAYGAYDALSSILRPLY